MKHFIYTDNRINKVVFECDAEDILVADEQLKTQTGFVAVKCPFIGCEIKLDGGLTISEKSV
jgi:hypothetical protein